MTESSLRLEHRGSGSLQFDEESSKSFNLAFVRQDLMLTASLALNLQQFLLLQPPKCGGGLQAGASHLAVYTFASDVWRLSSVTEPGVFHFEGSGVSGL